MKNFKKILALLLALVMVLSLFAGCAKEEEATTEEPSAETNAPAAEEAGDAEEGELEELTFGLLAPLTGPNSKVGEAIRDAATLAMEEIDYTVAGYKLNPVWIDDQGDPQVGVKAYEQAIVNDGIQCSVFANFSSAAIAEMEVAAKYQIPHFVSLGASEIVNEKFASDESYQCWLKTYPVPAKLSTAYLDMLESAIEDGTWTGEKKFYVYGEDGDWARSLGTGMGNAFSEAGWERVGEDYFPATTTDFYSLLSKMKESGATVVMGTIMSGPSAAAFIKQAREVGLDALIICEAVTETENIYELCGDALENVVDCRPDYIVDPAAGAEYEKKFAERFGYETSAANSGVYYENFLFWLSIVEKTKELYGEVNSETLLKFSKEELQTGNYVFEGPMVMRSYQYNAESVPDAVHGEDAYYHPVLQYQGGADGRFVSVYPNNNASAAPVFPEFG